MKLLKYLLLISGISISGSAIADHTHYLGLDGHWRSQSIQGLKKNLHPRQLHGGNIHTGIRFDNFWGIEAGFHLSKGKKNASTSRIRGFHFGLYGVLPLDKNGFLDVIGGAGVAHIKQTGAHPLYKLNMSRVVPRAMGGLEFRLCRDLKLRTAFTYEHALSLKRKAQTPRGSYGLTVGLIYGL